MKFVKRTLSQQGDSLPSQENINYLNDVAEATIEDIIFRMTEAGIDVDKINDGTFVATTQEEADLVNGFLEEQNVVVRDIQAVNDVLAKISVIGKKFNKIGVTAYGLAVASARLAKPVLLVCHGCDSPAPSASNVSS